MRTAKVRRVVAVVWLAAAGIARCDPVEDAARLTVDIEKRLPGSRVQIQDLSDGRARRVEVTIRASSFGEDVNLAEEGREVAELAQRRYELRAETDTIAVAFQTERQAGPLATRKSAMFVYPVSALTRSD